MKRNYMLSTLCTLLIASTLLAGCSASSSSTNDSATSSGRTQSTVGFGMDASDSIANTTTQENFTVAPDTGKAYDTTNTDTSTSSANTTMPISPESNTGIVPNATQQIIYRAYLSIETTDFDSATAQVESFTTALGGFIEQVDQSGTPIYQSDGSSRFADRYASYTLRIPVTKLEEALSKAGALGNVTSSNRTAENVTAQITDNQARINTLKVQEQRLLELLAKADTVDSLIALESRLSDVRYEIDSTESQLQNLQTQVSYSTVNISLSEVTVYSPTAQNSFGQRLSLALQDGMKQFGNSVQNLVLAVVRNILGIFVWVIILLVLILCSKRLYKTHRMKRLARAKKAKTDITTDAEAQDTTNDT